MTLRLVIEHTPHPQPRAEVVHHGGDLSIGRGPEADWQIVDPDMFVSRRHCVVSGGPGAWRVTDASRGGTFVDGAETPLGTGNSRPLEHGMRLRLGDVVIRVELDEAGARPAQAPARAVEAPPRPAEAAMRPASGATPAPRPAGSGLGFTDDDFFAARPAPEPVPERPASLPERFDDRPQGFAAPPPDRSPGLAQFDDPFSLDPLPSSPPAEPPPRPAAPQAAPEDPWPDPAFTPARAERAVERARPAAAAPPEAASGAGEAGEAALHAAFFRGLGLAPDRIGAQPTEEEMEALGRRFRALADGLLALLRARALEKQNVRVAQTVIGRADVNPLKFLPTTDEALAALVVARGAGYLPPDEAIAGAFRDLSDHQARSWGAMQAALRRMIDRFDPAEIERAMAEDGRLQTLLAGGRGPRLWQLYTERYREIAKSAEERFLGDVGVDFRDAYEGNGRKRND